ncbi:MAG TPA: DUF3127 domain-containing protein [Kofleriaceae bacterium]|nr:DUF3127 domain-containing protein [Kofleriaceae bacterium]
MAFDAVGKLHAAFDTKQVSERFTKREFVVEIADGKYPQLVLFQLTGDRCGQLDDHKVGDSVRVTFNVRGREWRSPQGEIKYFNSLDVWKLEPARADSDRRGGRPSGPMVDRDEPRPIDLAGPGREDDIPF